MELQLSLEHPLVAKLERVFETRQEIQMVMEHLKGGEVFDQVIRKGHFSEDDGAKIMRQMLSAVAHLHENEIAHLDVKLENFVFQTEACDQVQLIDFGFATKCDKGPLTRFCGSAHTMSPEMLKGKCDTSADIWALGVIAYMMLCGSSPWANSEVETRSMIHAGRPMYRAEFFRLSAEAQDFIRSLLVADPEKRPDAKTVLNHKWLEASADVVPNRCSTREMDVSNDMSDGESTTAESSRQHSTAGSCSHDECQSD